ncbi:MAG TPA: ferredoxin-thioredoxin reductase catalytic domain-containing protein [Elusimicrobiales bacterium]|nr:ferredoxin-thioredoxin reductase catalytic domain-containing protein [Elusimicrobiales bacterium]
MSEIPEIAQAEIDRLFARLDTEARAAGYLLNPDTEFTKDLVRGLLINEKRYGYWACPCRLADGIKEKDLDIVCPCDYRDQDINEYGTCYCALYVSPDVAAGKRKLGTIPERRPAPDKRGQPSVRDGAIAPGKLKYPVWRCKVCGYLAARDNPPEICPICKVKKDRFERFL